ncbi:uncharacterized protein [Diadema antillarum]|uniref:uncharacterized protein n=1 Tax=Diadema antillarum TaxID=105358 RepID=UPI003A84954A
MSDLTSSDEDGGWTVFCAYEDESGPVEKSPETNAAKRIKVESSDMESSSSDDEAKRIKVEPSDVDSSDEESDGEAFPSHRETLMYEQVLYRGRWHAFKAGGTFYKNSKSVLTAMLFPDFHVNDSVPVACDDDLGFLIDTSKLRYAADLTCDATGKYKRPSYSKSELVMDDEHRISGVKEYNRVEGQRYTLVRKYYPHRDTVGFYRTIYEVHKNGARICPNVIIRYEWRAKKTPLRFTPHGNSKHSVEPFIRSKREMLDKLRQSVGQPAREKMIELFEEEGGSEGIQSFSSVPRNRSQIYRHRQHNARSDFKRLVEMSKSGNFVRSVELTNDNDRRPYPRCVLYTDQQIADVKRNCSDGRMVTFDTTFKCDQIFVTIVSYRHQSFVSKCTKKDVLMPGPILLHSKRDSKTYKYFGDQISKALGNQEVSFHASDEEAEMLKGLQESKTLKKKGRQGDSTCQITVGESGSISNAIAKWIRGLKTWVHVVDSLEAFVKSKYKELKMAVIGLGEQKVAPAHEDLQKTPVEWARMTLPERRGVLESANLSTEDDKSFLSIPAGESGITGFPAQELEAVWKKASSIVDTLNSIVDFPSTSRQMICFDGQEHYKITERDLFVCDKHCKSFMLHDGFFCEHTLAAAEQRGKLADLISKINAKRQSCTASGVSPVTKQYSGSGKEKSKKRRAATATVTMGMCHAWSQPRQPRQAQPFCVTFKQGSMETCYGCNQPFSEAMYVPPYDLVFKKLDIQEWFDRRTGEIKQTNGLVPTYYHFKLDCLRCRYPYTELRDIIVFEEIQKQLTADHKSILREFGIDIA